MNIYRSSFIFLFMLIFTSAASASERMTPAVKAVLKAQDAVVNIRTETVVRRQGPFNDPFFGEFMGYGGTYSTQSLGTGLMIDKNGKELHKLTDLDTAMADASDKEIALRISSNRKVYEILLKPQPSTGM